MTTVLVAGDGAVAPSASCSPPSKSSQASHCLPLLSSSVSLHVIVVSHHVCIISYHGLAVSGNCTSSSRSVSVSRYCYGGRDQHCSSVDVSLCRACFPKLLQVL